MSAKLRIKVENTSIIGAPPSGYISLFTGADTPATTGYTFNHLSVITPGNELFRVPYLEEDLTTDRGLAFGGSVDITGARIRVSGDTYLGNDCSTDELHVNSTSFFYCNTNFIGPTTFQSSTFSGDTTVDGNLEVTKNVYITGDTTICGHLNLCNCNAADGVTGTTSGYSQTLTVNTITGCSDSTIVIGPEVKIGNRNTPVDLVKTNLTQGLRVNSTRLVDFPITFSGYSNPAVFTPENRYAFRELDIVGDGGKFVLQSGYTYDVELRAIAVTPTGETAVFAFVGDWGSGAVGENTGRFIARNLDGVTAISYPSTIRYAYRQEQFATSQGGLSVGLPASYSYPGTLIATNTTTASTLNTAVLGVTHNPLNQTLGVVVSGLTDNTDVTWNVTLDYKSIKFN
jgi:hypothetical protein